MSFIKYILILLLFTNIVSSGFDTFLKLSDKSIITSVCPEEEDDKKTEKETKDASNPFGFLKLEELFLKTNCILSESFFSSQLFLMLHPYKEITCPPPDFAQLES